MSSTKYDVVIIGGGHNGLVAATYLARAGKSVRILEANPEIGGASQSVRTFPEYDANLSRYSYLIALLPDKIVSDLGLSFECISREVSSYTPYGENKGLYVSRIWDALTESSFNELDPSGKEAKAWQAFYAEIAEFAEKIAPTMLQPLKTRSELKQQIDLDATWQYLIEEPIGKVITERFHNDVVRGVVLTDALIATESGVEISLNSKAIKVESTSAGVTVELENGETVTGEYLLSNAAPGVLAKLRQRPAPKSLDGSQMKINILLKRLPQLKSGIDPRLAFAGTFHANESFTQCESVFTEAHNGVMPQKMPIEMYCHTLTDPSILGQELQDAGYQTLTLFGLHTPASLFDGDNDAAREAALQSALASLNEYLAEPIEDVIAAIEVKTPLDIEEAIALPRGNIFHKDLSMPFREDGTEESWGVETDDPRIFICGAGAVRGGGVSGIPGHNAAMAILSNN